MPDADWLVRFAGDRQPAADVAAAKLREVGEDEIAQALEEAPKAAPTTFGVPCVF